MLGLGKAEERRIQRAQITLFRQFVGVTRGDNVQNENIPQQRGEININKTRK
jgi:hypothetical protein